MKMFVLVYVGEKPSFGEGKLVLNKHMKRIQNYVEERNKQNN